jgi:hypothetical protein
MAMAKQVAVVKCQVSTCSALPWQEEATLWLGDYNVSTHWIGIL